MELNVKVKSSICKGVLDVYTYTIDKGDADVIPYYLMPDGSYKVPDEIGLACDSSPMEKYDMGYYYVSLRCINTNNIDIQGKRTIALIGGSEVLIAEVPLKIYTGNYYLFHEAKFAYEPKLTYNGSEIQLSSFIIEDKYIGEIGTQGYNTKYYLENGLSTYIEFYTPGATSPSNTVDVPAITTVSNTTITITINHGLALYDIDRIKIWIYGSQTRKTRNYIELHMTSPIKIDKPIKLKFTYTFRC